MRVLIFEPSLSGHHLEYLQHLYNGAVSRLDCEFVFAVPHEEWSRMKGKCSWPEAENVKFVMLDDSACKAIETGSMLAQSWKLSKMIRRIALEYKVNEIFLITLAGAIPFLPLILSSKIKISGIIYNIYLRAPKNGLRGLIDKFRYWVMSHNRSMSKVFILNDPNSMNALNEIYHTNKFINLPDPVSQIDLADITDLRSDMGISPDKKVFLHFGAMEKRKGTLEILKALCLMTKGELADKKFIFAGRVGQEIYDDFYRLIDIARTNGADIFIRDEFCSFEYIHSLCRTADCLLIPYTHTSQSSGVLGYAAVHRKPVIGPGDGLIGELIKDNKLGITISKVNPENIAKAITEFNKCLISCDYAKENSVEHFIDVIFAD